jgi:hypothetical protein
MTPYTDIEVTDKYIIREFTENIDPIELPPSPPPPPKKFNMYEDY